MRSDLIVAGATLTEMLERENAALAAMDLRAAAAMFPAKDAAASAFAMAESALHDGMAAALNAEQQRLARALAERLRELAEANRRLLERAINVQGQVLGTIARAVAQAPQRSPPPRYGATGAVAQAGRQPPVVLWSRV